MSPILSKLAHRLSSAALLGCLAVLPLASATAERGETPTPAQVEAQVETLYGEALKAYGKKDYPAYYAAMSRLAAIRPDGPEVIFRLAAAAALTGRAAEAERLAERLAALQVYRDLAASPDFAAIGESAGFRSAVAAMAALKLPVGTETVAFRLREKDFIPEAVAWDAGTKSFLVSSVHRRKVVRVGRDGAARELVPEGRGGLGSALGIEVDAGRRILYVCGDMFKQTLGARPEDLEKGALFAFQADTGKLLGRWSVGGGAAGHTCDSLAVSSAGTVYVSDGVTGEVTRLRRGGQALETFLPAGVLLSAQSPAFSADEKVLFIPDYARGLFRVDVATRAATLLAAPKDVDLAGIDGLVFYDGSLIAVQNGIEPNRVVRLRLSPGLDRIEKVETLARSLPVFDGPTLATVVDGTLYYVANSQWDRFDDDGKLPAPEKLAAPVILKIPLR